MSERYSRITELLAEIAEKQRFLKERIEKASFAGNNNTIKEIYQSFAGLIPQIRNRDSLTEGIKLSISKSLNSLFNILSIFSNYSEIEQNILLKNLQKVKGKIETLLTLESVNKDEELLRILNLFVESITILEEKPEE